MISFPFDSEISGYNADGSPIYDRAADSAVLRKWMSQYFSDGIHYDKATGQLGFTPLQGSGLTTQTSAGVATIQGSIAIEENISMSCMVALDINQNGVENIVLGSSSGTVRVIRVF